MKPLVFYNLLKVVDNFERRQIREDRKKGSHAEPKPYYCYSAPNLLPENGHCHRVYMIIVFFKLFKQFRKFSNICLCFQ